MLISAGGSSCPCATAPAASPSASAAAAAAAAACGAAPAPDRRSWWVEGGRPAGGVPEDAEGGRRSSWLHRRNGRVCMSAAERR